MRGEADDHKTLPDAPSVPVLLRRSRRARRMTLRVSALDGRVTVTVPRHVSDSAAMAFVADKRRWLDTQISRVPVPRRVAEGVSIPVAGVSHLVSAGAGAAAPRIPIRSDRPPGPQVKAFVVAAARQYFGAAVGHHATRLGRVPGRIALRDTRSRWGSCSSEGNLMFSWRLILAPPEVFDYVAAHEVAHLVHMDHSRAFWTVVETLCPDYAATRAWLREQGAALHAWSFEP